MDKPKRPVSWGWIVVLWVVSLVLTGLIASNHGAMRQELLPLKEEFKIIADGSYRVVVGEPLDGRMTVSHDYAGLLDDIIEKRDKILSDRRYIIIGKWHSVDGFKCLYFKLPW